MAASVIDQVASATTSSRSPSFTLPTSPVENDVIIGVFGTSSGFTFTSGVEPSGWVNCLGASGTTLQASDATTGCVVLAHLVTAGEDTANTVTWTLTNCFTNNETGDNGVFYVRGADWAALIDAVATAEHIGATDTPHTFPAITGTDIDVAEGLAIRFVVKDALGTYTQPTGHTTIISSNTNQGLYICQRNTLASIDTNVDAQNVTPSAGDEAVVGTLIVTSVSSGTPHTQTPTDNVGITDSATVAVTRALTATDNVGVTDSATVSVTRALTSTDNVGIVDSVTVSVGRAVDATDNVGIVDSATQILTLTVTVTDPVGIGEDVDVALDVIVDTAADLIGITDTTTEVFDRATSQTDNVGVTDTTVVDRITDVADSVGITDTVDAVVTEAQASTDDIGIADNATVARDINIPEFGYVDFPGAVGNYLSTPDAAAIDIVGDICIVARVAMDTWTPAAAQVIVGKYVTTGNQRSYRLVVTTSGQLFLGWSNNGTTILSASATLGDVVTNGIPKWVAATLDVDNGSTQHEGRLWVSDDGTNWTQLTGPGPTAGTTSIHSGTAALEIGAINVGALSNFDGKIMHVSVRDGTGAAGVVGGTEVFRFDANTDLHNRTATTIRAFTGQTVTVNRSGSPDTTLVPNGDAVGIVDGVTTEIGRTQTSTDAVGITDSATVGLVAAVGATDVVDVTDSATVVVDYVRQITDPIGIGDEVSTAGSGEQTATDPVGITDSVTAALVIAADSTDAVGIADSAITVFGRTQDTTDVVGVTDSVAFNHVRDVTDPVGIIDSIATAGSGEQTVSDPVGIIDSAAFTATYLRDVTDPVGITDSVSVALTIAADVIDAIGIADSVDTILDRVLEAIDPIGITDPVTLAESGEQTVSDPVGITDSATPALAIAANQVDVVGITDSVSTLLATAVNVSDVIGLVDSVDTVFARALTVVDPVGITDPMSTASVRVVEFTDPVGIVDSASGTFAIPWLQVVADVLGIVDSIDVVVIDWSLSPHIVGRRRAGSVISGRRYAIVGR